MSSVKNTYHIADMYHHILQKHPLQYEHQFTIEFITPLGETGSIFDGDEAFGRKDSSSIDCVTYWGQSANIPEQTIVEAKVNFLANDFVVPGVVKFGDKWDMQLIIDQELTQYRKLENWQNYISNFAKSSGGKKTIPHVQAKVNLLDNTMQSVVKTFIIEGIWIQSLGKITFDYTTQGGSKIATCMASFTYQYFYEAADLENPTASDPLAANAIDTVGEFASVLLK